MLLVPALAICSSAAFGGLPSEAASHPLAIQVCRANVHPCQKEVSIPEHGTVELDLVLGAASPSNASDPLQIAAWETHFRLGDSFSSYPYARPDFWPTSAGARPLRPGAGEPGPPAGQ